MSKPRSALAQRACQKGAQFRAPIDAQRETVLTQRGVHTDETLAQRGAPGEGYFLYVECAVSVDPTKNSFARTIRLKSPKPLKALAHGLNPDDYQIFQVIFDRPKQNPICFRKWGFGI
ncbi:hypothetical protein PS708_04956 [Pseudomonas fluorescens]|nr:hypothetical protein PS708_04956 [Pseudomonas fluorescens]